MKSLFYTFFMTMMGLGILSGCSEDTSTHKTKITVGLLPLAVHNAQRDNIITQWDKGTTNATGSFNENDVYIAESQNYIVYYPEYSNVSDLVLALEGGKIDAIYIQDFVASYLRRVKPEFLVINDNWNYVHQMILTPKNQHLRDQLDSALASLKEDEILDELALEYIKKASDDPDVVTLPSFPNAPTFKVGVTGVLPPLDYMTTSGEIAGFNVALMSAISEKLKVNFVPVSVEMNSWTMALKTGKIDVMFWQQNYNEPSKDTNELLFTTDFYTAPNVYIMRRDFPYQAFWLEYFTPKTEKQTQ